MCKGQQWLVYLSHPIEHFCSALKQNEPWWTLDECV